MKLTIPIIILLCIFASCKKGELVDLSKEGQKDTVGIDPLLKSIILFRPGSYWVYQDSMSNRIDTLRVNSLGYDYYSGDNYSYKTYCSLFTYCNIHHNGNISFGLDWPPISSSEYMYVYFPQTPYGSFASYDSVIVNGTMYHQTYKTTYRYYNYVGSPIDTTYVCYTAVNYGIIRKEKRATSSLTPVEVWKLTSSHLVR